MSLPDCAGHEVPPVTQSSAFGLSPCFPLVSCSPENMGDLDPAASLSIIDEVLSCRETPGARFDVFTCPPSLRVFSEQPETLDDGIDQPVCYIVAGTLRPI